MRRALAIAFVLAAVAPAFAQKKGADEEEEKTEEEAPAEEEEGEGEATPSGTGKDAAKEEEAEDTSDEALRPKQNLTGHDLGTKKRENEFERNRFFVDKVDTEKTEEGTLIQGSIASSSFFYTESGGTYEGTAMDVGSNTGPSRFFTELRLQTDFRHIAGSRWEARADARVRFVNTPANDVSVGAATETPDNRIQSGLTGQNEYEIRELWLIRAGKRSDFFFGRQFIPDLGGLKIDGLRLDYAFSPKVTVLSFAGLFPVRGSRSLSTDYIDLKAANGTPAGKLVGTGGGGVAYRTINAYGALGVVAQVPQQEQARVYATSNGYYRSGSKLDVYHLLLIDVIGAAVANSSPPIKFTNVSAGANYKPDPRLRITGAFHRVDTETLNVQAGAFLDPIDNMSIGGNRVVQNEAYILRIATNMARLGVSAGLGHQQRFEISAAATYRNRPAFTLETPDPAVADISLPAANSVELWGGLVDRRFFFNTRVGIDGSYTFKVGELAYQRSLANLYRLFVNRLIQDGRGEWEAELSYTRIADAPLGNPMTLGCGLTPDPMTAFPAVVDCYGHSNNTILAATGQLFYRIADDWFGIGNLSVMRITNKRSDGVEDPAVLGFTGFVRVAKRF